MIKRIITGLAIVLPIVCFSAVSAFAADNSSDSIELNGTKLDVPAYDQDGYLYLPLRAVGEALGYTVEWSAKDHAVTLTKADDKKLINFDTYQLTDGDHQYYIDEMMIDGRAYLDEAFFNDSLGLKVSQDGTNKAVSLNSINKKNSITIKNVNETSGDDKLDITLNYPMISGLADQTVQDLINAAFKKEADDAKQLGLANIADYPEGMTNKCETYLDYRIKYDQNNLLSVVFLDYQYMGGAHGTTAQTSYTFDLKTGKDYAIKDLFQSASDYTAPFNNFVKSEIKERDLYELTTFSAIALDQGYYLDNSGVTIYFQQYEYFPYAAGIQTFKLDYATLKEILNPDLNLMDQGGNALTTGTTNELTTGDTADVTLKGNPTTGYTWQYTIADESIIKLDGESSVTDSDLIGAGSTFTWNFKALKPGETKITFKYYRAWEGNENAQQTVEYIIKVN
jgi:predicted secreted protein